MVLGVLGSVMSASALFLSAEDGLKQLLYEDNGVKMENIISLSESVSLPVAISGTNLIAQKISPYEGPFLEDGTDREVVFNKIRSLPNSHNLVGRSKARCQSASF